MVLSISAALSRAVSSLRVNTFPGNAQALMLFPISVSSSVQYLTVISLIPLILLLETIDAAIELTLKLSYIMISYAYQILRVNSLFLCPTYKPSLFCGFFAWWREKLYIVCYISSINNPFYRFKNEGM